MVFDILLGLIFIAGAFALWYRISQKIPPLAAIPDRVITERLQEDSARLRFFLLHFRTFYREQYYHDIFWRFAAKALYRSHITLMRLDNLFVRLFQKVRVEKGIALNGRSDGEEDNQQDVLSRPSGHRMEEVRQKKG